MFCKSDDSGIADIESVRDWGTSGIAADSLNCRHYLLIGFSQCFVRNCFKLLNIRSSYAKLFQYCVNQGTAVRVVKTHNAIGNTTHYDTFVEKAVGRRCLHE